MVSELEKARAVTRSDWVGGGVGCGWVKRISVQMLIKEGQKG